jgi:hypothetical protein
VKFQGKFLMYYSAYREAPGNALGLKGFPAVLALAESSDGRTWVRKGKVMSPTAGFYDNDAIYSPTVIVDSDNQLKMIYAGHCYLDCRNTITGGGVALVGARSSDGVKWTKISTPVHTGYAQSPSIGFVRDGIAEPSLQKGSDGKYYLFITGLRDDARAIGIASSASVFGKYTLRSSPIVKESLRSGETWAGALAPSVYFEAGKAKMWYLRGSVKSGTDLYRIQSLEQPFQ